MKSKEEFIAGIYEKAANYAEEEKKTKAYAWKTPALYIAAAAVICVGLAGMSAAALWHGNGTKTPEGNDGIALLSAVSEGDDNAPDPINYRMFPVQKEVQLTGTLESVDETEGILWIHLETGELAAIAWEIMEEFPAKLSAGTKLMAAGEAGTYGGAKSERSGTTQLALTDMTNLWIWMEKENTYKNYNSEGQE